MPNDMKYYFISFCIAFILLGAFIISLSALFSKKQKKNRAEKTKMQFQFNQTLLQTQIEIQEQTLNNISEEIHDNIGQVLSLVKLNLNTFPDNLDAPVREKLSETELLLSKAIDDLRELSQRMHGNKISSLGLETSIERELKFLQNTGRFKTQFHVEGNRYSLEPQKEMVLFRMVQESLNNVVKHAGAKAITVELLYRPGSLVLQVIDDGKGFNPELNQPSKTGLGLNNMYNRSALIGAIFSLHSSTNNGTTINIELPTTPNLN